MLFEPKALHIYAIQPLPSRFAQFANFAPPLNVPARNIVCTRNLVNVSTSLDSAALFPGVGVDDMFVIVNAFDLTDKSLDLPTRIGRTLATAGASITAWPVPLIHSLPIM
jgi:hypothetical protein